MLFLSYVSCGSGNGRGSAWPHFHYIVTRHCWGVFSQTRGVALPDRGVNSTNGSRGSRGRRSRLGPRARPHMRVSDKPGRNPATGQTSWASGP